MGKVSLGGTTKKPSRVKREVPPQVYTYGNDPNPPLSGFVKGKKGQGCGKDFVAAAQAVKAYNVEQNNTYKVEDILRMGKENFFKKVSPKIPVPIPNLDFTEEEKAEIDKLFAGK